MEKAPKEYYQKILSGIIGSSALKKKFLSDLKNNVCDYIESENVTNFNLITLIQPTLPHPVILAVICCFYLQFVPD